MSTRPTFDALDLRARMILPAVGLAGLVTAPMQHRLFWRFCRFLSRRLQGRSAVIGLGSDSRIRISLDDPYWLRLVARAYVYEPEIAHLLNRLRDLPFAFIDCGANLGYWSILASSQQYGGHQTIAIEGSGELCGALRENCRLNGDRFRVLHAAVADVTGARVWFTTGDDPQSATLQPVTGVVRRREEVTTIALDDLGVSDPSVIKLDVEGAEIEAMHGARRLLERGALLCYEDHSADTTCAPTRTAFELGLVVFWGAPDGRVDPIPNLDAARRIKTRRSWGYNFLACRPGSVFVDRLRS